MAAAPDQFQNPESMPQRGPEQLDDHSRQLDDDAQQFESRYKYSSLSKRELYE